MTRAALLATAALLLPGAVCAQAVGGGITAGALGGAYGQASGVNPTNCPYGTGYVSHGGSSPYAYSETYPGAPTGPDGDGCANADFNDNFWAPGISGPGQYRAGVIAAIASGQSSSAILLGHPMPHNMTTFDFPIGYDTTQPQVDIASASASTGSTVQWGTLAPGCGFANNATTVPELFCGNTSVGKDPDGSSHICTIYGVIYVLAKCLEVYGIDFSGLNATIPHVGAELVLGTFDTPSPLIIYFHDNKFATTSNSTNAGLNASGSFAVTSQGSHAQVWTRFILHNEFDGGSNPSSTRCWNATSASFGPCTGSSVGFFQDENAIGDRYIDYNVVINTTGRPVTSESLLPCADYTGAACPATATTPGHLYDRWNFFNTIAGVHGGSHGEWIEQILGWNDQTSGPASGGTGAFAIVDSSFNVCEVPSWEASNTNTACIYQSEGHDQRTTWVDAIADNNLILGNNASVDPACRVTFTGYISSATPTTVTVTSGAINLSSGTPPGVSGANCTANGWMLVGSGIQPNLYITSSGTSLTSLALASPGVVGGVGSAGSPVSMAAQFVYTMSAAIEWSYSVYQYVDVQSNYLDATSFGSCFGAPGPNTNNASFTATVDGASPNSNLTVTSSISGTGQILSGQEVFSSTGADLNVHTVSETSTSPQVWSLSGVLSEPAGTTLSTGGPFTIGTANFGSGDPRTGGSGNLNLLNGALISGFYLNAFGYTAQNCTGVIP